MNPEKKAVTGNVLRDEVHAAPEHRIPLIQGFLYEKSVLMISSDPGLGKSVVATCAMAQMSCGVPVFGALEVPKPVNCYYLPLERGKEEVYERLRKMEEVIPINYNNIWVNENFIGCDLTQHSIALELIETIKYDCPKIQVLFLDPIYQAVAGDLASGQVGSKFSRFSAFIQHELGCSNWLNHHTSRDTYSLYGRKIEKNDPFYGSQWLKAHCTGAYYLKECKDTDGVILMRKKDSHSNLLSNIPLGFDDETYVCDLRGAMADTPVTERLETFLKSCKKSNKKFTFRQLEGCMVGVSTSYLRELIRHPQYTPYLKKHKNIGSSTLYEVLEGI